VFVVRVCARARVRARVCVYVCVHALFSKTHPITLSLSVSHFLSACVCVRVLACLCGRLVQNTDLVQEMEFE